MIFECRQCGKTSANLDMVLEGTCDCGCSHFRLVSEKKSKLESDVSIKESLRRDLHRWIDMNIDALDSETIENLSVSFLINDSE